jgi:hypothetical protein
VESGYKMCVTHRNQANARVKKARMSTVDERRSAQVSSSSTAEQSHSQTRRERQEHTETKIDRVIHHNADGTSVTTETVVATTNASEVITSFQTTIKAIHTTAVSTYHARLSSKYATVGADHDRVRYLTELLQKHPSPFHAETMYASLQSMTMWELAEKEEAFILRALMDKDARTLDQVLANLPQTSALAELLTTVKRDVDVYLPYQVYRDALKSEAVEKAVHDEGRRVYQERLRKHLEDPVVQAREELRQLRYRSGMIDFGDRFINEHEFEDLEAQEKLQRKLASKCVADQLGFKNWNSERCLRFDSIKDEHQEKRMEESVSIYDQFNDFGDDLDRVMQQIWEEVLKPRVCEHYLILQLLVGKPMPPPITIYPESVEHTTHRRVKATSFFFSNYYKYWNTNEEDEVAHFTLCMPGSFQIQGICVQMSLLHNGWNGPFQEMLKTEVDRYQADPAWAKVTPENLILRHLAQGVCVCVCVCAFERHPPTMKDTHTHTHTYTHTYTATPDVTKSIDRLLTGCYADDGKTQQQMLAMVDSVYVNHDPGVASPLECLQFSRLTSYLPASYKQRLNQTQAVAMPPGLVNRIQNRGAHVI